MTDVILMCANPAVDAGRPGYYLPGLSVPKLDMIDNYTALSAIETNVPAYDGLHPNSLGYYSLMARNIVNSIESALHRPA